MGPITLFDKSFLQSLSIDESVWFDHYFYPNICPLFYVETLADLTKDASPSGRSAEDQVRIIADKMPDLSGGPCVHHRELCISNLMGVRLPMNGQIPVAGARPVQSADGHKGVVYDATPEAQAFTRWQHGDFKEVERRFARGWRDMLTSLDLPGAARRMQALGIDSKGCKSIEQAHQIATALIHSKTQPFEQMGLLFTFVDIPPETHRPILERWSLDQFRPLAEYAPYAAHVLSVEIFFQVCIAANLISTGRASNRVDVGYLFYLPFCMLFVSSDKLHRKCAAPFLRPDQDFVWGHDLKAELGRLNTHFAELPEQQRESGVMKFARSPVGENGSLMIRLWDKHLPNWRERDESGIQVDPEGQKNLVESLRKFTDAPAVERTVGDPHFADPDRLAIQRFVRQKKGSWWLLPKGLKVEEDEGGKPPRDG